MNDKIPSAGIEIGYMKDSIIRNSSFSGNAGGAIRIGKMDNSKIHDIAVSNGIDSADLENVIKQLRSSDYPGSDQLAKQLPEQIKNKNYWKKLIDIVGSSAAKVAIKVLSGAALDYIKRHIRFKGLDI